MRERDGRRLPLTLLELGRLSAKELRYHHPYIFVKYGLVSYRISHSDPVSSTPRVTINREKKARPDIHEHSSLPSDGDLLLLSRSSPLF
jgi:hypothetical protein